MKQHLDDDFNLNDGWLITPRMKSRIAIIVKEVTDSWDEHYSKAPQNTALEVFKKTMLTEGLSNVTVRESVNTFLLQIAPTNADLFVDKRQKLEQILTILGEPTKVLTTIAQCITQFESSVALTKFLACLNPIKESTGFPSEVTHAEHNYGLEELSVTLGTSPISTDQLKSGIIDVLINAKMLLFQIHYDHAISLSSEAEDFLGHLMTMLRTLKHILSQTEPTQEQLDNFHVLHKGISDFLENKSDIVCNSIYDIGKIQDLMNSIPKAEAPISQWIEGNKDIFRMSLFPN